MKVLEITIFVINEVIGRDYIGAVDAGDTIFVHIFGAYFGLTVARCWGASFVFLIPFDYHQIHFVRAQPQLCWQQGARPRGHYQEQPWGSHRHQRSFLHGRFATMMILMMMSSRSDHCRWEPCSFGCSGHLLTRELLLRAMLRWELLSTPTTGLFIIMIRIV